MAEDVYKTITTLAEGIYTEKKSKFIAIALPVKTVEEIKEQVDHYQKKYYDARHVTLTAYFYGYSSKKVIFVPAIGRNKQNIR